MWPQMILSGNAFMVIRKDLPTICLTLLLFFERLAAAANENV